MADVESQVIKRAPKLRKEEEVPLKPAATQVANNIQHNGPNLLGRLFARHRKLKITLCIVIFLYIYYLMLAKWGTIFPLFVYYYTAPFEGKPILQIPYDWKPESRVVVSLSTLPHHLNLLEPTLSSLLRQTLKPDVIYLNLPYFNRRLNISYGEFKEMEGITVNRCDDYGPLTKLIPTLEIETDPETIIITLDDDQLYEPTLIRHLVWYAEHFPTTAFGACGWSIMRVPGPLGVVSVYAPNIMRSTSGTKVDVLQACCGNTYRRKFFDLEGIKKVPAPCFTTDDLWISGYLSIYSGVSKVLIPNAEDKSAPKWKSSEPTQWRLSTVNYKGNKDLACVSAIEKEKAPWKTVSQQ